MLRNHFALLALLLGLCFAAHADELEPSYADHPGTAVLKSYVFDIVPVHSPLRMHAEFEPLLDYINSRAHGYTLKLEVPRNWKDLLELEKQGKLEFFLSNPYRGLALEKRGYRVIARVAKDPDYRGVIVVRKDSGIRKFEDLRSAVISFQSPTSFLATLSTKYLMKQSGFDADRDAKPMYVGTQDSVLMNVYTGKSRAGCVAKWAWLELQDQHPEMASALEVRWSTRSYPGLPLLVRKDLPERVVKEVRRLLLHLHDTKEGRKLLQGARLIRFEPENPANDLETGNFVKDYATLFGHLPEGSP